MQRIFPTSNSRQVGQARPEENGPGRPWQFCRSGYDTRRGRRSFCWQKSEQFGDVEQWQHPDSDYRQTIARTISCVYYARYEGSG